jgi:multisubunit Na+/H+ antiporter MnhF subunit
MLQRIQTLYLLFTCGLLASLFFIPMCETLSGARDYSDYTGLLILLILSLATSLGTLFLYRRRTWQIRLCILNSIVLTGFQGWIACYFFTAEAAFSISAVFPLIAVILTVIAARYIARDEAMIRNTGRIRN